jgi:hypothetical protein
MIDMQDVRKKFNAHKGGAKKRGIEFKFTFNEWWDIWKPHWANRGRGKGQFVMCRTMDKGAYEVGNVRIDTPKGNGRTKSYVSFDKRWKVIKTAHAPVVAEESKDDIESDFEKDWVPRHLKGYSKADGWIT